MKNKIAEWLGKWGFVIILGIIGIGLLFALGCSIYTSITNLTVGLIGIIANAMCLAVVAGWIGVEINNGRYDG